MSWTLLGDWTGGRKGTAPLMWVPATIFLVLIPENLPDPGLPLSEAELDSR